VTRWIDDLPWRESLERLASQPTVNIEGLVAGYTGPGGKTILPARGVAKLDLRLVPDMTAADCLAKLRAHLAQRGFGDIEVNMTGGYDPTETAETSGVIRAQQAVMTRNDVQWSLYPRSAGSGRASSSPASAAQKRLPGQSDSATAAAPCGRYFVIGSSIPGRRPREAAWAACPFL
jgi:hypothetical protein